MCMCVYIYVYTYVCMCIYIYIYTQFSFWFLFPLSFVELLIVYCYSSCLLVAGRDAVAFLLRVFSVSISLFTKFVVCSLYFFFGLLVAGRDFLFFVFV